MTRRLDEALKCLRLLPRAMAVILTVSAPVLAIPHLQAADETIIVAPAAKNSGVGFVLMVSLRRG